MSKSYYLFKLKFQMPVHFGSATEGVGFESNLMTCYSDTFFSALCHEVLLLYGEKGILELENAVRKNKLRFSDLLPYKKDKFYIPKPVITFSRNNRNENFESSSMRKKLKGIRYIEIDKLEEYIDYLKNSKNLDIEKGNFGVNFLSQKVGMNGAKPEPYQVGLFRFGDDAGLYFVLSAESNSYIEKFKMVLKSLSFSGIGGERSSGYGKFDFTVCELNEKIINENCKQLYKRLVEDNTNNFMSISLVLPSKQDFEGFDYENAYYNLIPRTGFILSNSYSKGHFLKKRQVMMFDSGSCFSKRIEGCIVDVSNKENSEDIGHRVLRYGKGIYLCLQI